MPSRATPDQLHVRAPSAHPAGLLTPFSPRTLPEAGPLNRQLSARCAAPCRRAAAAAGEMNPNVPATNLATTTTRPSDQAACLISSTTRSATIIVAACVLPWVVETL